MILVIMAAGRGSRYGKLKQFDPIGPNGEFLMEFNMYNAIKNGFKHIVIISQKEHLNFIQSHFKTRLPKFIKLDVVSQNLTDVPDGNFDISVREKPWGTAHAVWATRSYIESSFAVINADDYYGEMAFKLASDFISEKQKISNYALIAYTLKDTLSAHGSVSRGICKMDENYQLKSIHERLKIKIDNNRIVDEDSGEFYTGDELISMNFWICHQSIFDEIESYFKAFLSLYDNIINGEIYLPKIIHSLILDERASTQVIQTKSKWFGVTHAEDRLLAMRKLKEKFNQGQYPSPLWKQM